MRVIAESQGFVLSFNSLQDMKGHVANLLEQIKWVEQENIPPPYLYCVYDAKASAKGVEQYLNGIKKEVMPELKDLTTEENI